MSTAGGGATGEDAEDDIVEFLNTPAEKAQHVFFSGVLPLLDAYSDIFVIYNILVNHANDSRARVFGDLSIAAVAIPTCYRMAFHLGKVYGPRLMELEEVYIPRRMEQVVNGHWANHLRDHVLGALRDHVLGALMHLSQLVLGALMHLSQLHPIYFTWCDIKAGKKGEETKFSIFVEFVFESLPQALIQTAWLMSPFQWSKWTVSRDMDTESIILFASLTASYLSIANGVLRIISKTIMKRMDVGEIPWTRKVIFVMYYLCTALLSMGAYSTFWTAFGGAWTWAVFLTAGGVVRPISDAFDRSPFISHAIKIAGEKLPSFRPAIDAYAGRPLISQGIECAGQLLDSLLVFWVSALAIFCSYSIVAIIVIFADLPPDYEMNERSTLLPHYVVLSTVENWLMFLLCVYVPTSNLRDATLYYPSNWDKELVAPLDALLNNGVLWVLAGFTALKALSGYLIHSYLNPADSNSPPSKIVPYLKLALVVTLRLADVGTNVAVIYDIFGNYDSSTGAHVFGYCSIAALAVPMVIRIIACAVLRDDKGKGMNPRGKPALGVMFQLFQLHPIYNAWFDLFEQTDTRKGKWSLPAMAVGLSGEACIQVLILLAWLLSPFKWPKLTGSGGMDLGSTILLVSIAVSFVSITYGTINLVMGRWEDSDIPGAMMLFSFPPASKAFFSLYFFFTALLSLGAYAVFWAAFGSWTWAVLVLAVILRLFVHKNKIDAMNLKAYPSSVSLWLFLDLPLFLVNGKELPSGMVKCGVLSAFEACVMIILCFFVPTSTLRESTLFYPSDWDGERVSPRDKLWYDGAVLWVLAGLIALKAVWGCYTYYMWQDEADKMDQNEAPDDEEEGFGAAAEEKQEDVGDRGEGGSGGEEG